MLRSFLTHEDIIRFFFLSFSLTFFPFLSLSLFLFLFKSSCLHFLLSTLSTLHSSGDRLFVSTYGAPLILLCDNQMKRDSLRRIEQSRCPQCLVCRCTVIVFFFFFFVCYETHARANFVLSPTPRRPLVTVSLNLDTYDSLCFPDSPSLSHILALTSPNRSFSFSPSLSLRSFLATFIHFDKGRDVSFKTIPYTRPASALIDYDAYCIEKGCPPVDSRKGFPA